MQDVKGIIFDMDGVILDTERIYLEIWTKVFKNYNYNLDKYVYISVMGRGRKVVKEVFKKEYGDNLPIEEMYIQKDELLKKAIENNEVPMKEGAIQVLNYLKSNNYKIALATSAMRERVNIHLSYEKIDKYFDVIITKDDITKTKPDPEIFMLAAEKLGIDPTNCVVIEDSPAGIGAAYNAKMQVWHVEDLKAADEYIKRNSNKCFKNMHEILEYLKKNN